MSTTITRRGILKALGIGAAVVAAEPILEPVRKLWFVGSNAPVGSRIERAGFVGASYPTFMIEEVATVDREELLLKLWTKVRSQEDLDTLRDAARSVETLYHGADREKLMADYVAGLKAQNRKFPELSKPTWHFANGSRIDFGDEDDNYYDYQHLEPSEFIVGA